MLTKEDFIKNIELIKKCSELQHKLSDLLELMSPGCRCDVFLYSEYEENTIALLKHAMELPEDNDDIEYFIYDLCYGEKYYDGCYTDSNKNYINFSSAGNVYDYLFSLNLSKS